VLLYGVGLLLILAAIVDRRRKSIDPALTAKRKNVRQQRSRIARAAGLPKQQAAEEVADAMRALVAELPDVARSEAEAIIAECESIVYAPTAQDDGRLDTTLVERASAAADRFQQSALSDHRRR
jgi:hypothetical protein